MAEDTQSWLKSSFCSDAACIEVALGGKDIHVRNSKNVNHELQFSRAEWLTFLDRVAAEDYHSL